MPNKPYPTLSEVGLVYAAQQKIEWIFADYVAAKHSQSIINFGRVSSLSFDEFTGNYEGIRTAEILQRSIQKIYEAYFDSADIQVTDSSLPDSNEVRVQIKGVLVQDGKNYQLNEVLGINNGRINRLAKFN